VSGRRDAARRLGALAAAAAGAGCVEITTAEQGVLSIRFDPLPPSIVAGDTLRDSLGRVQRLRAVAFNEAGDSVAGAAFTFGFLPLGRDTASGAAPALTVDPTSGLVRADSLPRAAQARVSATFGSRLQALDTIAIVRRPTRLQRVGAASVPLRYLCTDSSRTLLADTLTFGTVSPPLAVRLRGDSVRGDTTTVPVPSYLVRYRITFPATIPSGVSPYGDTRPALYLTNGRNDRPLQFDTTNASGQTTTALRVIGPLLTPANSPDSVVVVAQALYRGVPIDTAGVRFTVRVTRIPRPGSTSCP
jgi:hypothetical protein